MKILEKIIGWAILTSILPLMFLLTSSPSPYPWYVVLLDGYIIEVGAAIFIGIICYAFYLICK